MERLSAAATTSPSKNLTGSSSQSPSSIALLRLQRVLAFGAEIGFLDRLALLALEARGGAERGEDQGRRAFAGDVVVAAQAGEEVLGALAALQQARQHDADVVGEALDVGAGFAALEEDLARAAQAVEADRDEPGLL